MKVPVLKLKYARKFVIILKCFFLKKIVASKLFLSNDWVQLLVSYLGIKYRLARGVHETLFPFLRSCSRFFYNWRYENLLFLPILKFLKFFYILKKLGSRVLFIFAGIAVTQLQFLYAKCFQPLCKLTKHRCLVYNYPQFPQTKLYDVVGHCYYRLIIFDCIFFFDLTKTFFFYKYMFLQQKNLLGGLLANPDTAMQFVGYGLPFVPSKDSWKLYSQFLVWLSEFFRQNE